MLTPQDIATLKQEILSSLHCSMPGIVESFDPLTQTASVRPALKRGSFLLPVIHNIPVFFPGSRTSGITWPVAAGDECLLIFADFDIDRWFSSGEAGEPDSARQHDLPDAFAFVGFRSRNNVLSSVSEDPSFFGMTDTGKKDIQSAVSDPSASGTSATFIATLSQNAQGVITPTKKTVRTMTAATADAAGTTGLVPAPAKGYQGRFLKGNATWAIPAVAEGGTGQTGTGSTTTIADIATAASGCEITTAQYAYWGKVAMVRLIVKKTAAVSSGTTTLCTLASGKRPKYNASGVWAWNKTVQITTGGNVQVNGAITANSSMTLIATFILA